MNSEGEDVMAGEPMSKSSALKIQKSNMCRSVFSL